MRSTNIHGWPVAEDGDPVLAYPATVDGPFKDSLDTRVPHSFANAAARDIAIPVPVEGQVCYLEDLHQSQSYRSPGGWLPLGGVMPFGLFTGNASQSLSLGVWTKCTLPDAPTALRGGLTWDAAQHSFSGPPGVYMVTVKSNVSIQNGAVNYLFSNNVDTVTGAVGLGMHNIPAMSANPQMQSAGLVEITSPTFKASFWAFLSAAANLTYKTFTVQYVSQR